MAGAEARGVAAADRVPVAPLGSAAQKREPMVSADRTRRCLSWSYLGVKGHRTSVALRPKAFKDSGVC